MISNYRSYTLRPTINTVNWDAIFGDLMVIFFFVFTMILGFFLICKLIRLIGQFKVLQKAGENGWKIFVPFYGKWTLFKMFEMETECIIYFLAVVLTVFTSGWINYIFNVVKIICLLLVYYRICVCLGHGIKTLIAVAIIGPAYWLYLGFNKDTFDYNRLCTICENANNCKYKNIVSDCLNKIEKPSEPVTEEKVEESEIIEKPKKKVKKKKPSSNESKKETKKKTNSKKTK